MENKRCDIDDARNYLEGKLDPAAAAEFEKTLATDRQFREDFEFNKDFLESMRIHFRSELKNKLKELDRKESSPPKIARTGRVRRFLWVAAAAVAALIAITFFLVYDRVDSQEVFANYYSPYYNVLDETVRSGEEGGEAPAMQLYDQRRYREAISAFNARLQEQPGDYPMRFYKSISHLSLGQADSAIVDLELVLSAGEGLFEEPARWYLGLAHLNAGNTEAAKLIFSQISAAGGSYSQRAKEILRKIGS